MANSRASYLDVTQQYVLRHACRDVAEAFGLTPMLVGSCLERADFRDVDIRVMLEDGAFDRMFPNYDPAHKTCASLAFLNAAISTYLAARTGLPIDFQFQRRSDANAEFGDGRPRQPQFVSAHRP